MLRNGDWVLAKGRIALFMGWFDPQTAIVHFVDPQTGETLHPHPERPEIVDCPVPVTDLAMAKARDLPAARVRHLTPERLKALGYE